MTSFETIRNLTSFRECEDRVVPRKKVGKILEAGRNAPSPGNVQSAEFIVVEDDHKKEALANHTGDGRAEEAPTAVIVLTDDERMERRVGPDFEKAAESEAACAVQNMRIVAEEEGISSAWISGFDPEGVRGSFRIPKGKTPRSILLFGYAEEKIEPEQKFGMNEVVWYDEYENQLSSKFDQLDWKGVREERRIYGKKSEGILGSIRKKLLG